MQGKRRKRDNTRGTNLKILTRLSQPPEASRFEGPGSGLVEISEPGTVAEAQDTALTPIAWAGTDSRSQLPSSSRYVSRETLPSEEAHASARPNSCGAQLTEFTEAVCPVCSFTRLHVPFACSFQMYTRESYEHEAIRLPNFGCDL